MSELIEEPSAYIEEIFEQDSLQNIYLSLSISENPLVDLLSEKKMLIECIDNCFDEKFRLIETKELESNVDLLNNSFAKLLLYCAQYKNYKKAGYIFIEYCEYFDLDSSIVYQAFQTKLKAIIDHACKKMVGADRFQKCKFNHNGGIHIPTLFDIIKK